MAKEIRLSSGAATLIDDEDYEWLSQWKWRERNGYAVRTVWDQEEGKARSVSMHRAIMQPPVRPQDKFPYFVVDHINRNRLDNRRANLRVCTMTENAENRGDTGARPNEQCIIGRRCLAAAYAECGLCGYAVFVRSHTLPQAGDDLHRLGWRVFGSEDDRRLACPDCHSGNPELPWFVQPDRCEGRLRRQQSSAERPLVVVVEEAVRLLVEQDQQQSVAHQLREVVSRLDQMGETLSAHSRKLAELGRLLPDE